MSPSRRLEGQVAWITGAASGMGEAIAELFAQEGAGVAIADTPMLLLVDMQSRAIAETEPIKKVS